MFSDALKTLTLLLSTLTRPSWSKKLMVAIALLQLAPTLTVPNVDSTWRQIAQWKHIIATDLTSAFYQIPLSRASMKYCDTFLGSMRLCTLHHGHAWFRNSAGGAYTVCHVLGHLLEEGVVAKIADDLYCGAHTPQHLLHNWCKVLQVLHKCDLRLSASKTVINTQSTTILGWVWTFSTLQATPHCISALALCPKPNTVGGMGFFTALELLKCLHMSSLVVPLSLLHLTTPSLAMNVKKRSCGQTTSMPHSEMASQPSLLPVPSHLLDQLISCRLSPTVPYTTLA